jgi:hypothetical protein
MYELLRSILLLPILLLLLAHFILLTVRLEHVSNLSLFIIEIPAIVAYGGGILIFLGLALFLPRISKHDRIMMAALVSLLLGSLISQLLIARKFEIDFDLSWTGALLPFEIGVLVTSILVLAALIVRRRDRQQTSVPGKSQSAPAIELMPHRREDFTSTSADYASYLRAQGKYMSDAHLQALQTQYRQTGPRRGRL